MGEIYRRWQEDPVAKITLKAHNLLDLQEPEQTYLEELVSKYRSLGHLKFQEKIAAVLAKSGRDRQSFGWFLSDFPNVIHRNINKGSDHARKQRRYQ